MSLNRKQLLLTVFERMDQGDMGYIPIQTVLENFDFASHPGVAEGNMRKEEAVTEFIESCGEGDRAGGTVKWFEFVNYFSGLSLSIEDDDYFELMIRNALRPTQSPSRGRPAPTHANDRRVKVIYNDNTQEVVELEDMHVENNQFGIDAILQRLFEEGYRNIADVQIIQ